MSEHSQMDDLSYRSGLEAMEGLETTSKSESEAEPISEPSVDMMTFSGTTSEDSVSTTSSTSVESMSINNTSSSEYMSVDATTSLEAMSVTIVSSLTSMSIGETTNSTEFTDSPGSSATPSCAYMSNNTTVTDLFSVSTDDGVASLPDFDLLETVPEMDEYDENLPTQASENSSHAEESSQTWSATAETPQPTDIETIAKEMAQLEGSPSNL